MTKRKKIIVICAFLLISFIIPNKVKAKESASVKYQTHLDLFFHMFLLVVQI